MTKKINIDEIRIDGGTQPRQLIDETIVKEYADALENGATFPPITVFYDGAIYWLADGFHRYWANKNIGYTEMECNIKQGLLRDAILYSCGANSEHGIRRTNADKRKAVETLLKDAEWNKWSDYKIADNCNVSQPFVLNLRNEIAKHTNNIISINSENRSFIHPKNGKVTTMKTGNIGKKSKPVTYKPVSEFVGSQDVDNDYNQMTPDDREAEAIQNQYDAFIEALTRVSTFHLVNYPNNPMIKQFILDHNLPTEVQ